MSSRGSTPLTPYPGLGGFDVYLRKTEDGALGLNITAANTTPPLVQISGFKQLVPPGPAQACGFVCENDLIVGVSNMDVTTLGFADVAAALKESKGGVQLRLLRAPPVPTWRGIATYPGGFLMRYTCNGMVTELGPYDAASSAAAAFDMMLLYTCGTRYAGWSNFFRFLAAPVAAAEAAAAVTGEPIVYNYMSWTYAGAGAGVNPAMVLNPSLQRPVLSTRPESPQEAAVRMRDSVQLVPGSSVVQAAPPVYCAAIPGVVTLQAAVGMQSLPPPPGFAAHPYQRMPESPMRQLQGVLYSSDGEGAFALDPRAKNALLGFFRTGVEAACAWDSIVYTMPGHHSRNFENAASAELVLSLAKSNLNACRPELLLCPRQWLNGPNMGDYLASQHFMQETMVEDAFIGLPMSMIARFAVGAQRAINQFDSVSPAQAHNQLLSVFEPHVQMHLHITSQEELRVREQMKRLKLVYHRNLTTNDRLAYNAPQGMVGNRQQQQQQHHHAMQQQQQQHQQQLAQHQYEQQMLLQQGAPRGAPLGPRGNLLAPRTGYRSKGAFKGRAKKGRKRMADDDELGEEDEEPVPTSDSDAAGAPMGGMGGDRLRSTRARPTRASKYDSGEPSEADPEDEAPRSRTRGGGGDPTIAGPTAWRIDAILGVRYADLPLGPDDPPDEVMPDGTVLTDWEAIAVEHDKRQVAKRLQMPLAARRDWESLEYLVRWKGVSYLHTEWVASVLIKEQGTWGRKKTVKFVESELAHRMLDEMEARCLAGTEPPDNEAYFDEDLVTVERVLSARMEEGPPPTPKGVPPDFTAPTVMRRRSFASK